MLVISHTIFKILTHKARKLLIFLTPPLIDTSSEFLDEAYIIKLEGWGYCMVKVA